MTERRVTSGRQHAVQTFSRLVHVAGELLKTDGRIHQITQQQLGGVRFALQQQAGGLLQQSAGVRWLGLDAGGDGLFEITCEGHV